jgi:hypothetical protein
MIEFEDKSIYTQIFLLCEWFKMQKYCMSVKSNYLREDYSAVISYSNDWDCDTLKLFHKNLEKTYIAAIEVSNEKFNERNT